MTVNALVLQTWFDIANQHTGSAMNAYAIAYANGRSITDELVPSEQIIIPNDILVLKKEVLYLASKTVIPATGITSADLGAINPTLGIGNMVIGATFIVR